MTYLVRNSLACIIVVGISLALSCAQPLSDPPAPTNSSNPGTDRTDTIVVHDTLIIIDTVVVSDTVMIVDTVIVKLPDFCYPKKVCAQLGASVKELVWLFVNEEGRYKLDFRALAESLKPTQVLVVEVDGQQFEWIPSESAEFTLERDLVNHSTVTITTKNPSAFGHSINICLWVKKVV